jgi:hypothetical protein
MQAPTITSPAADGRVGQEPCPFFARRESIDGGVVAVLDVETGETVERLPGLRGERVPLDE